MTIVSNVEDVLDAIAAAERFHVQQVFKPIANEYRISIPLPGSSEPGSPLLFVKQKKMAVKEDIRFRLDPASEDHLFQIKSKSVFEFRGRHEVLDANGAVIGLLSKTFGKSLLRSHWTILDPAGTQLFEAEEDNLLVAVVRRFGDLIPYVGWLLEYLPFHFELRQEGELVGHYRRVLGSLRDRYLMEIAPAGREIDGRLLIAFAVALDALQDR
jgi:uncharacterized protein YxjI